MYVYVYVYVYITHAHLACISSWCMPAILANSLLTKMPVLREDGNENGKMQRGREGEGEKMKEDR